MVDYRENLSKIMEVAHRQEYEQGRFTEDAGIRTSSVAKLAKGENVQTDILVRICYFLNCDTSDIMEFDRDSVDLSKLRRGKT